MKNNNGSYSTKLVLWIIFYCYATFAALIFQKLLLPMFPGFHGGSGLIGGGDSAFFHNVATNLAESIRVNGWKMWTVWPSEGATGNVSLLAVLYVLFGNDPTVIIPVNAAIHASSGLLIFLIARVLWPGKVGFYSGIVTATLFVVFPSALNWYAQIHKDGFAILGMLIVFYSWLKSIANSSKLSSFLWMFPGTLTGLVFIVFVRPYNVKMLILSAIFSFLILLIKIILSLDMKRKAYQLVYFAVCIVLLAVVNNYIPRAAVIEHSADLVAESNWRWEESDIIPGEIDGILKNTAEIRVHNILYNTRIKARSLIDEDTRPNSVISVMQYIPRALQISLFAPFPNRWSLNTGIIHIVSIGETLIWYMLIPGIVLAFYYGRSQVLFYLLTANMLAILGIYGFSFPNIGTLYRIKYVYIFILMIIGMIGWVELVRRKYGDRIKSFKFKMEGEDQAVVDPEMHVAAGLTQSRSTIATAGIAVVAFTLLSSVLLVLRDVILARWFGLGNELDAFFIAMIMPMFLATVMSMPVGTVMVPPLLELFKDGSRERAQHLITLSSTLILFAMFVICLAIIVFSRFFIPVLGWGFSPEKIAHSLNLLIMVVPLLFFSGFVILGNSILNARYRFSLPALAQSVVPVIAILTLLVIAGKIGIYAMAAGMCIGQLANLFIVVFYVRKEGYSMSPLIRPALVVQMLRRSSAELKSLLSQYAPLVFSSFFVSLALPVNNSIAASLSSGSVSAFNLGIKFVIFFTGLIGTGISTVMLPYFSSYFARNRVMDARRELSFFLFLATVIPIPLTVVMFFLTGPLVRFIFGGGAFTMEDAGTVTRVIEYGIIQLPFFCTNMLFVKYANARRKNSLIMISSLLGLVLNVILNFVFIGRMGVAGIALATSLSMMCSTMLFIVVGHRYNDVSWVDVVFTVLTWLLFLTILLCYHFRSMSGVIIASTSLLLTVVYHMVEFFERKRSVQMTGLAE